MKKLLTTYLRSIAETTKQGDAREESYYPALQDLFSDFPLEKGRKTTVTVLPKPTEAGNPDFRIWDGDHFIVGYIEAKAPGTPLDLIESTEQLERYIHTFPNVILTDFYKFRLYREGVEIDRATIARHFTAKKLKTTPQLENFEDFKTLAERFFSFKLPLNYTAESLAIELAKRTRFLRDQVVAEELKQAEFKRGDIFGFYEAFKKYLLPNLTPQQFADLYSQTITYGLFAARTRAQKEITRKSAIDYIPQTVGILRDVFKFISMEGISEQMGVIVDDIVSILNVSDINNILDQYYRQGKGEDPIVHFYETFLNQYDPQTRERRGVYYTPEPVVKYIVKSVHELLKTRFDLPDGLADPSVTLLDPAAGTMTFPAEAIKVAVKEYVEKYGEGGKQEFIRNQILRNFSAFELMMAPYAIGHLKISFLLDSLGYKMHDDERFKLYLTNTLEMEEIEQIAIPGVSSLSEESHLAGQVKKDEPVLVIIGNPPYSGISSNINDWTEKLLKEDLDGAQSYYTVDGKPLGEKKVWLQDDYVKFLRFAQWKIQKAGKGIVAMITNHAYLDNPTFRGMRQSMNKTFDEIFILDLHGNSLKKEVSPDGSKDVNVFDIRSGVAIAIFIKNQTKKVNQVKHHEIFGDRNSKYFWLISNSHETVNYTSVPQDPPFYFFFPRDTSKIQHYSDWPSVVEIFPVNVSGIVTARDKFVIGFSSKEVIFRMNQFGNLSLPDDVIIQTYGLKNTRGWNISTARKKIATDQKWVEKIQKILYRPFDVRSIIYTPYMVDWGREDLMSNMQKDNIGLITVRQVAEGVFNHCFITENIVESRITLSNKGIGYLFPLYLYKNEKDLNLFSQNEPELSPNISEKFTSKLIDTYVCFPSPENVLAYIYAVLFSNIYRSTYAPYLQFNYPRIPFTSDYQLFKSIAGIGQRLIDVHLLKSSELDLPVMKFQGKGDNQVIERPYYSEEEQRLYVNPQYYFEGLESELWNYKLCGYQVLSKYLKERKGQRMDDPRHYIRIATALGKTIEIQSEIDDLYPEVEKDVIKF